MCSCFQSVSPGSGLFVIETHGKSEIKSPIGRFSRESQKPAKLCVVHKLIRAHGKIIGLVANGTIDKAGKVA
jgi:hypothetical protein